MTNSLFFLKCTPFFSIGCHFLRCVTNILGTKTWKLKSCLQTETRRIPLPTTPVQKFNKLFSQYKLLIHIHIVTWKVNQIVWNMQQISPISIHTWTARFQSTALHTAGVSVWCRHNNSIVMKYNFINKSTVLLVYNTF
jgi:hypothetical protein